jgi:hypothetical protein
VDTWKMPTAFEFAGEVIKTITDALSDEKSMNYLKTDAWARLRVIQLLETMVQDLKQVGYADSGTAIQSLRSITMMLRMYEVLAVLEEGKSDEATAGGKVAPEQEGDVQTPAQ